MNACTRRRQEPDSRILVMAGSSPDPLVLSLIFMGFRRANLVCPGVFFRVDPRRVLPSESSNPWCVLPCRPLQNYDIISCARARSPTPVDHAMDPRGARPQGRSSRGGW